MALGALTTITDVLRRPDMATLGPSMVARAAEALGGQMVRNTAPVIDIDLCGPIRAFRWT